eukprot:1185916-Prorocentrum_minimum.AAC.2
MVVASMTKKTKSPIKRKASLVEYASAIMTCTSPRRGDRQGADDDSLPDFCPPSLPSKVAWTGSTTKVPCQYTAEKSSAASTTSSDDAHTPGACLGRTVIHIAPSRTGSI